MDPGCSRSHFLRFKQHVVCISMFDSRFTVSIKGKHFILVQQSCDFECFAMASFKINISRDTVISPSLKQFILLFIFHVSTSDNRINGNVLTI